MDLMRLESFDGRPEVKIRAHFSMISYYPIGIIVFILYGRAKKSGFPCHSLKFKR